MAGSAHRLLRQLERWGTAAENAMLVLLLGAMMVVAVGQIGLRLFFDSGYLWADELLKLMVLWIAMIASVAASRGNRHLRIDVLSHVLPPWLARLPRLIVDLFAAFICGVLAWQSFRYVQLSYEFEDTLLTDIPAWMVYGIVPFAFAMMCYRFVLLFVGESLVLLGWRASGTPDA
jgi:TRAP-type C4-dicarboxylate transport system permease small subunit